MSRSRSDASSCWSRARRRSRSCIYATWRWRLRRVAGLSRPARGVFGDPRAPGRERGGPSDRYAQRQVARAHAGRGACHLSRGHLLSMGFQGAEVRRGARIRTAMSVLVASLALVSIAPAQDTTRYTHADTLRGSNGPARAWGDVQFYDLHTRVNPQVASISVWNGMKYGILQPSREMQSY